MRDGDAETRCHFALSWAVGRGSDMSTVVHSLCSVLGCGERVRHIQCDPFFDIVQPALFLTATATSAFHGSL